MINKPNSISSYGMKIQAQLPKDALSNYVCSWLKQQKIKQDLIKRIKYKKQQGDYAHDKLINDQTLTQQYFKIWMEQPTNKPLMKLAMHPLLTLEDQKIIDQISTNQRAEQIKLSSYLTAGTVAFYWIFLSRMARFQRFFNDRNKNRFVNGFKKIFAIYSVLIIWQASLTSHHQKLLPQKVHQKGLFKKYGIQYQEKNV